MSLTVLLCRMPKLR